MMQREEIGGPTNCMESTAVARNLNCNSYRHKAFVKEETNEAGRQSDIGLESADESATDN